MNPVSHLWSVTVSSGKHATATVPRFSIERRTLSEKGFDSGCQWKSSGLNFPSSLKRVVMPIGRPPPRSVLCGPDKSPYLRSASFSVHHGTQSLSERQPISRASATFLCVRWVVSGTRCQILFILLGSCGRAHLATELWPAQRSLQHHTSILCFHQGTVYVRSDITLGVYEAVAKAVISDCIVFLAAPRQPDGEIRVADVVDAAVREVGILPGRFGIVSLPLPLPRGFLR